MEAAMTEYKKEFWKNVLEKLSGKLPSGIFDNVILQAKPGNPENGILKIFLPYAYMTRRITQSDRTIIENVISEMLNTPIKVEYSITSEKSSVLTTKLAILAQQTISSRKKLVRKKGKNGGSKSGSGGGAGNGRGKISSGSGDNYPRLKSSYTFDNYIVGDSNRLVHAASMSVSETPGGKYNPLFIYSLVGLGKTHLLHAIAHKILELHPEKIIQLTHAETYTTELIEAINDPPRSRRFRSKFRHCDVLLIDDIHFLIGKDATKEAFFHTFNDLYEMGKQIVLTCDRHPRELRTLESRLISRFHLGLIVDIQRPSYETRLAILTRRASQIGLNLPAEILSLFAVSVQGSIRSLEGCLQAVEHNETTLNRKITLDEAKQIAVDYSYDRDPQTNPITVKDIMDLICHHYRIAPEELTGKSRESRLTHPRHIGMYLSRKHTSLTLKDIARAFKRKDHATIYHGANKIDNGLNLDAVLAREVKYIEDILLGRAQMK
jgi:chromosomal replication initiator protein